MIKLLYREKKYVCIYISWLCRSEFWSLLPSDLRSNKVKKEGNQSNFEQSTKDATDSWKYSSSPRRVVLNCFQQQRRKKWKSMLEIKFIYSNFMISDWDNKCERIIYHERNRMHTTDECITEKTIISASEGVNPLPKSTEFRAKSLFNPLRASKHVGESIGKISAKLIHFITYNQQLLF